MDVSSVTVFSQLKEYAHFLRKGCIPEAARRYLTLARQEQLPLLKQFGHLPENQILEISRQNWDRFLAQMEAGNALEYGLGNSIQWQRNGLPEGITKEQFNLEDVVSLQSLHKRVLLQLLPLYTADLQQVILLADELEQLYARLTKYSYAAFADLEHEKLVKSEAMLAEAQATAHIGSWEWDVKRNQVYWSDELFRIFGYEPDAFALDYQSYLRFQHPEDRAAIHTIVSNALATKQPYSVEHRIIRKDGSVGWILGKGRGVVSPEGEVIRLTGVSIDITEQKLAEKELQRANSELRETNEELVRTEELLRELNDELEERVGERTAQLQAATKRIAQLLEGEKRARQITEASEQFLSSIIDQSPFSTWIADASGTQIRVNQAFLDLFSIDASQLKMGTYNLLEDEKLRQEPFFEAIKSVFTQGTMAKFARNYSLKEVRHSTSADSQSLHIITTIFPIKDAAGHVTHAVIQHEDTTQRKRAEEALKTREEQLRLLTDSLPVLITYVDQEERYRFNNKTYEEWFDVSRTEVYGKTLREVIGEDAYAKVREPVRQALRGEIVNLEMELPYQGAGNRFVAINYIPHWVQGKVAGYYALVTDVSAQKNIQQALEASLRETSRKNEELNRINADLDNFVYTASHDLRSPVTNLDGLQRVLAKRLQGKLGTVEQELMEHMSVSVTKLNQTIKDLTEIVKVQKELDQPYEPVVFARILEDVRQDIGPMIAETDARISADFGVTSIPFARKHLRSILYNLLSNAIKYRSPDRPPTVAIQTYPQDEYVCLQVQDNGLGIPADQLTKVFMMFKRLHTHVEGSGVGLYMVKRIIENNGGRITVESEAGKGTAFTVFFRPQ